MTLTPSHDPTPAAPVSRRVFAFNGGSFFNPGVRRILSAAGYAPRIGWPGPDDAVLAWGHTPVSRRADWVARRSGAQVIRVEDPFYRSVLTGRDGAAPLGLLIDHQRCHYDSRGPSDLENILAQNPFDDPAMMATARNLMDLIATHKLSKYNATRDDIPLPDPGYVLIVDQTHGDASIRLSGATEHSFQTMLNAARQMFPDVPRLIKTHPETQAGHRPGHFQAQDLRDGEILYDAPVPVVDLITHAKAVFVVSSQVGFEAIVLGRTPHVFGQPFYAGWGLSHDYDHDPIVRRTRTLTPEQLFAGACLIYPKWLDPMTGQLGDMSSVLMSLLAQRRAWREDHRGWDAHGMRLWKRRTLRQFFGAFGPVRFDPKTPTPGAGQMIWGTKAGPPGAVTLEDGFLRSKGLGAALTPPASLILDDVGIYFDPTRPSKLEQLIAGRPHLTPAQDARAHALIATLADKGLSKYNLQSGSLPALPQGHRILVPGQVEDDASIRLGTLDVQTNADLLQKVRNANPDAIIAYKPHPDVEAGLRPGAVPNARNWADVVLNDTNPIAAIQAVDAVHTMTSLLGLEALIHGKAVTCYGQPFYAGWGLTTDRHPHPRRTASPDLAALIYAAYIDYPRYLDPVTGLPCQVEDIIARLEQGFKDPPKRLKILAKLQGVFATYAHIWR